MPTDRLCLARDLSMLQWETLSPDFLVSHAAKDAKVGTHKSSYLRRLSLREEVETLIKEGKHLDEQMTLFKQLTIQKCLNALSLSHPEIPTSSKEPALFSLFRTLPHEERHLATLWLLNRLPYAGKPCMQCQYLTLSKRHIEEVHGGMLPLPGETGKKLDMELKEAIYSDDAKRLRKAANWIKRSSNILLPSK